VHLKIFGSAWTSKSDIDEEIKIENGECFCLLPFISHCFVFLSVIPETKIKINETLCFFYMGINLSQSDWEKNTEGVREQDAEENICG